MECLGWDFPPVSEVFGKIISLLVCFIFINGLIEMSPVLADLKPGLIDGDLDQPRAELRFATESLYLLRTPSEQPLVLLPQRPRDYGESTLVR